MIPSFKIIVGGKPYTVEIGDLSKTPISVVVNGETFEVEVEMEASAIAAIRGRPTVRPVRAKREAPTAGGVSAPAAPAVAVKGVSAPMAGKIVAIKVSVGDKVNPGDEVLVLEAMKMEQSIRATQEGVIKEIKVEVGQSVALSQVLLEFE